MMVKHEAAKASHSGNLSPPLCLRGQRQSVALDRSIAEHIQGLFWFVLQHDMTDGQTVRQTRTIVIFP